MRRSRPLRILVALGAAPLALAACADRAAPTTVAGRGLELRAATEPASPRIGANRLWLELRDAQGRPVEGARVAAKVHMPAMGAMSPMGGSAPVVELGGGRYRADFELDMGGSWLVDLDAEAAGGTGAAASGSLEVGKPGLRLEARGAARAVPAAPAARDEHAGHGAPEVPEAAGAPAAPPAEVEVPVERLSQIGVRVAEVRREPFASELRALGVVRYDESALHDVSLRVGGFVRTLGANAVGETVSEGDVLFTLYSPDLYAAQAEYLQALRSQADARTSAAPDRADALVRAALNRLHLAGVAPGDLHALAARGEPLEEVPVRAPASGTVVERSVVAGSAVEAGARLYRIAPLESVWLEAEVYESDLPRVREGQPVSIELPGAGGGRIAGRVAHLLPRVDRETRTARVRIALPNREGRLRPDSWATVWLESDAGERLAVPDSAVLHAGERSFVFLETGAGRFAPREVALGLRAGDRVEVVSGLAEGDRVVASGTFLIAAESRLRAALADW